MERPNPKTFVGTGKIEEIHQYVKENEISIDI
jgi:GTP-binding protein HflX